MSIYIFNSVELGSVEIPSDRLAGRLLNHEIIKKIVQSARGFALTNTQHGPVKMRLSTLVTVISAWLVGVVLANTESIRVKGELPSSDSPAEAIAYSYLEDNEHWNRRVESISNGGEKWFKVHGIQGKDYEIRVCWPASYPGDLSISYQSGGYVKVAHESDYYSHIKRLMESPDDIPFEIIMDPIILGVLPKDIIEVIALITFVCLTGVWVSKLPFQHGWL